MTMILKVLRKLYYVTIGRSSVLDRFFRYHGNPQNYWVKRGGQTYFEEQEAVEGRTVRSRYIAEKISQLDCDSLLEVGCGYGKQLKNIRALCPSLVLGGCDFSRTQLDKGSKFFPEMAGFAREADASQLPYEAKSFDAVMSSAVILHNEYPKAKKIIFEMIRVGRKYLIHNEDTDISFSRYGYDLAQTYRAMNFQILVSSKIPGADNYNATQFTIAVIPPDLKLSSPENIPLKYFKA